MEEIPFASKKSVIDNKLMFKVLYSLRETYQKIFFIDIEGIFDWDKLKMLNKQFPGSLFLITITTFLSLRRCTEFRYFRADNILLIKGEAKNPIISLCSQSSMLNVILPPKTDYYFVCENDGFLDISANLSERKCLYIGKDIPNLF